MKRLSSARTSKAKTRVTPKQPPIPRVTPLRKSLRKLVAQCNYVKPETINEMKEWYRKISGLGLIYEEAHAIEEWADHRFTTDEGRTFGLYIGGESILGRLAVQNVCINRRDTEGIERVKSIAGFILEIGTDDPPLVFQQDIHLGVAWAEHHIEYNVELMDKEYETLECVLGLPDMRGPQEGEGSGEAVPE